MDWNISLSRPRPAQLCTLTHPGPDGPHGTAQARMELTARNWSGPEGPRTRPTRTTHQAFTMLTCALTLLGSQAPRSDLTARPRHTRTG